MPPGIVNFDPTLGAYIGRLKMTNVLCGKGISWNTEIAELGFRCFPRWKVNQSGKFCNEYWSKRGRSQYVGGCSPSGILGSWIIEQSYFWEFDW
jgi:hypothetical protein